MTDYQVPRKGSARLDVVEGDLNAGTKSIIEASDGKLAIVKGNATFEGDCRIESSFECDALSVKHGGTLHVKGDLTVHKLLDALHSINTTGCIDAGEIDVGGRVSAGAIRCQDRIRVGGQLDVKGSVEAKLLGVGAQVAVGGIVKLQELQVGGVAEVGGGSISGKIQVGGKFETSGPLEFGEIQVYGKILLAPNSKGGKISMYGRVTAQGDLECDQLELMGRAEISGNCKTKRLESSGKFNVNGSLEATELRSWGQTEIDGEVKGRDIHIGGRFIARSLSSEGLELAGHVEASQGVKAKQILIRSGSKCDATLVGGRVDIGRSYDVMTNWAGEFAGQTAMLRLIGKETRVGDIYADEVSLGKASRCGRVYAEIVEFEAGVIAEEITYTKEVRGPTERVYINKPFPKKVERLPDPPF